jgi:hypothetical protein
MNAAMVLAALMAMAPASSAPAQGPAPGTAPPPGAPPAGVRPPFIPSVGTVNLPRGRQEEFPKPYIAGARQFLVNPGQSWQHLVEEIGPGDEVILAPGFHLAQTIVGLRGERGRPVFVRSQGPVPAAILCDADGLVLRAPLHVVVENLLFLKPKAVALTVEGSAVGAEPVQVDVTVRNCAIQGSAPPEQDGIRVRRATDVRIDSIRIDGWSDAAVEVEAGRRIVVRGLMAVPDAKQAPAAGVAILGGSTDVSITGCAINGPVRTAIRVGDGPAGGPLGVPCERVRIDRCLLDRPMVGIEFGNVREATASRVTFADPSDAIFAVAEGCGNSFGIVLERCLASWEPGALKRFCAHPAELRDSSIRYGPNMWFSKELPDAWAAIGEPYGVVTDRQVIDTDPDLEPATLRPRNPSVGDFGAYGMAPPPAPPAEAVPPATPAPGTP